MIHPSCFDVVDWVTKRHLACIVLIVILQLAS